MAIVTTIKTRLADTYCAQMKRSNKMESFVLNKNLFFWHTIILFNDMVKF
jgi:hypothetical protein